MRVFLLVTVLFSLPSWSTENEKKKAIARPKVKIQKPAVETPPPPPKSDPTQDIMEPAPAPVPDID